MAPRRRAAAEEEPEEEEQEQEQEAPLTKLKFNESLSWRPGSSIPAEQLLKRLDRLSKELADMDQETVGTDSLTKVAKELAHTRLLNHKDKGVRAFTASCVVEMLRLYAPNAPYTPSQLKEIFNLIINSIIPAVFDPSHPYHSAHKFVIQSLSEVKSIVILNDLDVDGIEVLLQNLFSNIFDGVSAPRSNSGELLAKDVEFMMQDMLSSIIEEASGLPQSVVDVIMAQFLRAAAPGNKHDHLPLDDTQPTLLLKDEPEAYQIAKHICVSFPEKMSRFVGQYFADVIMDATNYTGSKNAKDEDDSEDEDGAAGPSDSDLKELRKAHVLVREVWKAAPMILQNVVPQVEQELAADNVEWRQLAVETLGDLISGIGAAGPPPPPTLDPMAYPPLRLEDEDDQTDVTGANILTTPLSSISFTQTHPNTFFQFMNRKNDKAAVIRAAWTTSVGYILSTSAGGIGLSREEENALIQALTEKLFDVDEKVRLAAVKAIESFKFRDIVLKLGAGGGVSKEGSLLSALAERCRDRKPAVRVAAMSLMAKLWAVGIGNLLAGHEAVTKALDGIPSRIFASIYANDGELNVLIDRVTFEYLVPISYPPSKKTAKVANGGSQSQSAATPSFDADAIRAERVLLLAKCLDGEAKRAFYATLIRRQPQLANVVKTYVSQCEAYNGGVMDGDRAQRVASLEKSAKYIAQFLPDQEKARTDLMRFAKINERRYYHLTKFLISQESDFSTVYKALKELIRRIQGSKDAGILDTLLPVLYRSGYLMFNRSHLATIMAYSRTDEHDMATVAHEILNEISQHNPDLFKTHIGQLCKDLVEQAPTSTKENGPAAVETLKACSSYSRKYPQEINTDKAFSQTMINYALYAKPYKAAKYAVNILLAKKDEKGLVHATDLIQRAMKDFTYDSPNFLNKLAIISQLELLAPKVADDHEDTILNMAVHQLLLDVRTIPDDDTDPDWVDDADMDKECQAKLLALKILVNRMRAVGDTNEVDNQSSSVWKLLRTLVRDKGELTKKQTPKHHKARMRLLAAQLMLKLCKQKQFDDLLKPSGFNALAFTTQDAVEAVRHNFIMKLQKYLTAKQLRARFYTIVFLTAFEPQVQFKGRIEHWVRSRARYFEDSKQSVFEAVMARLLSLLAHHPDYSDEVDNLSDHAKYLIFYMSLVATEANLGLISKYAERVKQTQDAIDPSSENHRVLCDLAQAVIRKWQEKKNWVFNAFSGKVGIPVGLYTALQSHDEAQAIAEKQYLPEGVEEALDEILRAMDRKKQKRKSGDDGHEYNQPAKKARQAHKVAQPKEPKAPKAAPKKAAAKPKKVAAKPKSKAKATSSVPEGDRRRSGRSRGGNQSYIERDDSEDEKEMLEGVAEWEYLDGSDEDNEEQASDEEPASEPEPMDEDDDEAETNGKGKKAAKGGKAAAKATKRGEDDEESELSDLASLSEPEEDEEEEAALSRAKAATGKGKPGKAAAAAKEKPIPKTLSKGKAVEKLPVRASTRSKRKQVADSEMDSDDD